MMKFKRIETKNGRIQYWRDDGTTNKMVKAILIPDSILSRLETENEVEIELHSTTTVAPEINTKVCLFDEEAATNHKFINGVTIGLCKADYLSRTSGQIVQKLNEKDTDSQ